MNKKIILSVLAILITLCLILTGCGKNKEDENKVSKKQIEELAKQKFGDLAGLAQQYLFYWRRES